MRELVPTLLAVALLTLSAGCVAGPASPTPTEPEPGTETTTTYVVDAGELPGSFASVEMTFQVVLVEHGDDLGPCYPHAVRDGPYRPTMTPLATPAGDCHLSDRVTVDVAAAGNGTTVESVSVPADVAGHALIVTDVTVTLDDGTQVDSVKGIGGFVAYETATRPDEEVRVTVGIQPASEEARYDYYVTSEGREASN